MVARLGKSTRDDRKERETARGAGSSRKNGIRLETGRLGQRSGAPLRFFLNNDRQYHCYPLWLATNLEHRQAGLRSSMFNVRFDRWEK